MSDAKSATKKLDEIDWKAKEKHSRQTKLQRDRQKTINTDREIVTEYNRNAEKQLSIASLKNIKTIKDAEEIVEQILER